MGSSFRRSFHSSGAQFLEGKKPKLGSNASNMQVLRRYRSYIFIASFRGLEKDAVCESVLQSYFPNDFQIYSLILH
ncbi:MAG: hypothetical protein EAZ42_02400 [Verrucomicrobia bacterium]|nr:MAG: hypothetical protein EAZ42_02400 [Verrucomicrobiota bacterium]